MRGIEWQDDAKCRGLMVDKSEQDDLFFPTSSPGRGKSVYDAEWLGRLFCRGSIDGVRCPVLEECLEFALQNREMHGVWGGTSADDRLKILRDRRGVA